MQAIYTAQGLTIKFSRQEDFVGIDVLETLAAMYEEHGVDASSIHQVVAAMRYKETVQ